MTKPMQANYTCDPKKICEKENFTSYFKKSSSAILTQDKCLDKTLCSMSLFRGPIYYNDCFCSLRSRFSDSNLCFRYLKKRKLSLIKSIPQIKPSQHKSQSRPHGSALSTLHPLHKLKVQEHEERRHPQLY